MVIIMPDNYEEMLQDLDIWFEAGSAPELTEEELEEIERKADNWLMGCVGIL